MHPIGVDLGLAAHPVPAVPTMDRMTLLRKSELFREVPDHLLGEIDAELHEVCYPRDTVVFEQGDEGDAVYVVVDGRLALRVDGITLLVRRPGECVGEFALIDDEPRSATAVALTELRMLRWERSDFRHTLASDPAVARGIFRLLTGKLREDVESKVRMQLQHERWQQDLSRAREIQTGMLPGAYLDAPTVEIAAHFQPAAEVGGDFYDYRQFEDDRVGLIISDVTGHGFYSGLFVAMAKSCLHTQADFSYAPTAVMSAMRRALELSLNRQLLMTCCYAVVDPRHHRLTYANAGHPYPFLYRARGATVERLDAIDPILGALPLDMGSDYGERCVDWHTGDVLVLYSDGIAEARDPQGVMFEYERLEALVRRLGEGTATEVKSGILEALFEHVGPHPMDDDLTLVVAKAR